MGFQRLVPESFGFGSIPKFNRHAREGENRGKEEDPRCCDSRDGAHESPQGSQQGQGKSAQLQRGNDSARTERGQFCRLAHA